MFTGIISHTGELQRRRNSIFTFSAPQDFIRKLHQGSSVDVGKNFFTVAITPFTWQHTMLQNIQVGDPVNIESIKREIQKDIQKTRIILALANGQGSMLNENIL